MSNGRQIGSLVGSLIAAYFTAGASYAALAVAAGGAVGGYIGGQLDPEKIQGPRLDDLKVQVSTYGVAIPILYGTERATGNVIWSTDRMERSTTTRSGKGGGSVKTTTYSYFVHMRILLCQTPRDGTPVQIIKMLKDGKLIWDASSGASVGSVLASEVGQDATMVVYQGDAAQLPDPVEELHAGGPGSVPAYRNVASVSMRDVECPGGRIPQFAFVCSVGATIQTLKPEIASGQAELETYETMTGFMRKDGSAVHCRYSTIQWGPYYRIFMTEVGAGYTQKSGYMEVRGNPAVVTKPSALIPVVGGPPAFITMVFQDANDYSANIISIQLIDLTSRTIRTIGQFVPPADTVYAYKWAAFDEATGDYVVVPYAQGATSSTMPGFVLCKPSGCSIIAKPATGYGPCAAYGGIVHMMSTDCTQVTAINVATWPGVELDTYPLPGVSGIFSQGGCLMRADEAGVYALVARFEAGPANSRGLFRRGVGGYEVVTNDVNIPIGGGLIANTQWYSTFFTDGKIAVLGPHQTATGNYAYHLLRFNAMVPVSAKAKDIIADQCIRSGTLAYDVSGIPDSDTAVGYKLANVASARANIDPILTAFRIFSVDEDGLVKFKKYDAATVVAQISYDELGAYADGQAGDTMPLLRKQEKDLPRAVVVSYIDASFDFQPAAEREGRQVTDATQTLQVNLPLAMNSDQAKRVAATVLFQQWRSMNTRTTNVMRKYAYASPGDLVDIEYPRGTWKIWRLVTSSDTGRLLEWAVEPGDTDLFEHTAVGAGDYPGQQVPPLSPLTKMVLMNGPIMRDTDNNPGVYVAGEGYGPGWGGYTLWTGADDATLEERGTVTSGTSIGFCESALGDWLPTMRDTANSLIVNMGTDTLSSITDAVMLAGRTNLAWVGADGRWELVQFMTAASLGSGRYLLSTFLRGLYGTERFRGTHQADDTFILIDAQGAGMLRPNQSAGDIGQALQYRAVSIGRSLDSAPSQSFANTAVGLLPYSPWDARKAKAANNDQTLTWQRRTRLSTSALKGIVPLGESHEEYLVEFYTSSSFATRAASANVANTRSITITSAMQTSWGLTPGNTLFVRISQLSDVVNYGPYLEAIL